MGFCSFYVLREKGMSLYLYELFLHNETKTYVTFVILKHVTKLTVTKAFDPNCHSVY